MAVFIDTARVTAFVALARAGAASGVVGAALAVHAWRVLLKAAGVVVTGLVAVVAVHILLVTLEISSNSVLTSVML